MVPHEDRRRWRLQWTATLHWCDKVWKNRDAIIAKSIKEGAVKGRGATLQKNPAIYIVYDFYTGATDDGDAGGVPSNLEIWVDDFIKALGDLDQTPAITTTPEIQDSDEDWWYPPKGIIPQTLVEEEVTFHCPRNNRDITISKWHVGQAFIHFRKVRALATRRTYLNVKPEHRGVVFRDLLTLIWSTPDLSNAKVAGPHDGGRADAILIYTVNKEARDRILETIRPYCVSNQHKFGSPPAMTGPVVPPLPEVGVADEPPHELITRARSQWYVEGGQPQSFGMFRARLVFMALDRTKFARPGQSDEDRCKAFKRRVEKYFQAAGIDPEQSHLQATRITMLPMSELEALLKKTETD